MQNKTESTMKYIFFFTSLFFLIATASAQTNYIRAEGEIWKEECASCHGKDGKGVTKAGKRAGVKDFTDLEYQGSFTDDDAVHAIVTATKADGERIKKMKAFGEEKILTEEEILRMVAFIRGFIEE